MNATNRPVDFLLNIESPSTTPAQRRGASQSSNRNSELSALNRKENSFEDVYRQQRRDDNEVRQSAQQKRSTEQSDRHENRPAPTQQSSPVKQSRAETKTTSDGKALPQSAQANSEKGEASADANEGVDSVVGEKQPSTLELTQDVEVTVNFEDAELVEGESEVAASSDQDGEDVAPVVTADVDSSLVNSAEAEGNTNGEQLDTGSDQADVTVAQVNVKQPSDSDEESDAQQQEQPSEETVIGQAKKSETAQQQPTSQTADADVKARAAQVSSVVADAARETKQSRLGEAVESAAKGEVNTATQTKAAGTAGVGEQSTQQAPQERLAQLTAATDFKVLREQLAAGTVKIDSGAAGGAKGGAVDGLNAADTAGDRQPRLNSLTQASQMLPKPGVVSASVQQPVGSPEWGQAMSQRIMWLANRGISAAELQLNPRDMGPVEVRINVSGEQTTVQFSSQNAGVREALESSVVRLREMMESSGLNLADVDVSDQSQSEQALADRDGSSGGASGEEKGESDGVAETVVTQRIESNGLVDFYA